MDFEIAVRRNGGAFGKVKINRGATDWMLANKSKTAYYLDWAEMCAERAKLAAPGWDVVANGKRVQVCGLWHAGHRFRSSIGAVPKICDSITSQCSQDIGPPRRALRNAHASRFLTSSAR